MCNNKQVMNDRWNSKFTGNPYSYVCEPPPLKYRQTHVCRNSYTGTRTVPYSYSCLCERSLTLFTWTVGFSKPAGICTHRHHQHQQHCGCSIHPSHLRPTHHLTTDRKEVLRHSYTDKLCVKSIVWRRPISRQATYYLRFIVDLVDKISA